MFDLISRKKWGNCISVLGDSTFFPIMDHVPVGIVLSVVPKSKPPSKRVVINKLIKSQDPTFLNLRWID